jgi:hypothetical protein
MASVSTSFIRLRIRAIALIDSCVMSRITRILDKARCLTRVTSTCITTIAAEQARNTRSSFLEDRGKRSTWRRVQHLLEPPEDRSFNFSSRQLTNGTTVPDPVAQCGLPMTFVRSYVRRHVIDDRHHVNFKSLILFATPMSACRTRDLLHSRRRLV